MGCLVSEGVDASCPQPMDTAEVLGHSQEELLRVAMLFCL